MSNNPIDVDALKNQKRRIEYHQKALELAKSAERKMFSDDSWEVRRAENMIALASVYVALSREIPM